MAMFSIMHDLLMSVSRSSKPSAFPSLLLHLFSELLSKTSYSAAAAAAAPASINYRFFLAIGEVSLVLIVTTQFSGYVYFLSLI
jgi:hypothetical protein